MAKQDEKSQLDRREFLRFFSGGSLGLTLVLCLCILTGCGGGGVGKLITSPSKATGTVVQPNVQVLPSDGSVTVAAQDANSVTLMGNVPALTAGQVIVSGVGEGLLRKVVSASSAGGSAVVQTQQATLEDVFQEADIQFHKDFVASDFKAQALRPGITIRNYAQPHDSGPSNTVELDFSNLTIGNDDEGNSIKLGGSASLTTSLDFDCQIHSFQLQSLKVAPTIASAMKLSANIKGKVTLLEKTIQIVVLRGEPIDVQAGIVPVVFVPILTINLEVKGSLETGVEVSMGSTASVQAGFQYQAGQLPTPIASVMKQFDASPQFNLYTSGTLEISPVDPDISLNLYGVAGPYVKVQLPALSFTAKRDSNPAQLELTGDADFKASAGAKFSIFGTHAADFEIGALDEKFEFFNQTIPFNGTVNVPVN
jgi:hypothetical protein